MEDHPEYAQFEKALEGIREKKFEHIYRDPSAEWHREKNPEACYWQKPYLYCEAGSDIWAKPVRQKRFSGRDAVPPEPLDIIDVVATFVRVAPGDDERSRTLLAEWYAVIPSAICVWRSSSRQARSARSDPVLQTIREAVLKSKAHEIESDYGDLRCPERDCLEDLDLDSAGLALFDWWFEPRWKPSPST